MKFHSFNHIGLATPSVTGTFHFLVIASAAKQSSRSASTPLDCFAALAMTG